MMFRSQREAALEFGATERRAAYESEVAKAAPAPDVRIEAMQRSIDSLSMQVSQLGAEIAAMRGETTRAPATLGALNEATKVSEAAAGTLTEAEREDVREVLAQEFARQEAEREAQRLKREQEAAERRADAISKRLSLSAKDTSRLAEILVAENQKRRELFDNIQDAGFDREQMRQTMGELQTWKKDEMTKAFGTALAEQIAEIDQPRRGGPGGDFFGGRGNRGAGGGGGGNNNGGGD